MVRLLARQRHQRVARCPRRLADDFHVFAVEWEPHAIRFYVDDDLHKTTTSAHLPSGVTLGVRSSVLRDSQRGCRRRVAWQPGSLPTEFPQTMLVDYVRVFRRM